MDDAILDDSATETPPAAPPPDAADARFNRLEQSMAELTTVVRSAAEAVRGMPAGGPAAPANESPEQFLERMAADPRGTIEEIARTRYQQESQRSVEPTMRTMLEAASRQLVSTHRTDIDNRFGSGTFEELFKPQLDRDITQLLSVNPSAAANPETVQALVDRLYGGANFGALRERERAMETARARGVAPAVPTGGVPRMRTFTGDELPGDVEQFLRDVEKSTGEKIDRKAYAKLFHTGVESGPGRHRTSVADYLQAIGADADTKRAYLGEKQA